MDADGHNQKQLTDDAFYKRSLSVTPDGRYVVLIPTVQALHKFGDRY